MTELLTTKNNATKSITTKKYDRKNIYCLYSSMLIIWIIK